MANHSCLEDSFAAREAVIYMTSHPEELATWAEAKQEFIDGEAAKGLVARKAKEEAKKEAAIAEATEKTAAADDEKRAQTVFTMGMPALIPAPANQVPGELQVNKGPSIRKRHKGRTRQNLDRGDVST
jgi:hypothetical protein